MILQLASPPLEVLRLVLRWTTSWGAVVVWTNASVCGDGEVTQVAVDESDGGVPLTVLATYGQN